jgi:uroporphyrinogen-III synthase
VPPGQLQGFTVAVTADRRAEEQAALLARLGARVVHGPAVRTLPLAHEEGVATATRSLIAEPPDVVVATTGLGVRGWFGAAEGLGLDEALLGALARAEVLARGPKAAGAVVAAGLTVAWRAPSEQSGDLLDHLLARPLAGVRIAVQRDGAPQPLLADALRRAGADVVDVPVYAWTPPDDPGPALRVVEAAVAGRVDAVTFTSSPAVWNLLDLASDAGLHDHLLAALGHTVAVACVGPVCARSAHERGIEPVVQPRRGRLGAMVAALGAAMARQARSFSLSGHDARLQGALLVGPTGEVLLTERERALVERLSERPGAVVPKERLLERAWAGQDADTHAVEAVVSRLRRRLADVGATVETVPRRGYRLVP